MEKSDIDKNARDATTTKRHAQPPQATRAAGKDKAIIMITLTTIKFFLIIASVYVMGYMSATIKSFEAQEEQEA